MRIEIDGPTHAWSNHGTEGNTISTIPSKLYTIVATNILSSGGSGTYNVWLWVFDSVLLPEAGDQPRIPPIKLNELETNFFDVVHGVPFEKGITFVASTSQSSFPIAPSGVGFSPLSIFAAYRPLK